MAIFTSDYALLIYGILILVISGDILVRGSVSLARFFKISTLIVGVTVVSFGTSAPELIVSINAALSGHQDIAIGNVIGSNISNIALVLALTAIILPIFVAKNSVRIDWPVMMASGILLFLVSYWDNKLQIYDGLIFVSFLIIYIYYVIHKGKRERKHAPEFKKPKYNIYLSLGFITISIVGMYFGSTFLIDGASGIATSWGVTERVISVTVIAFGTSVPELSTSIIAAIKKESDISVGNILGSNIFNILAILGITASIKDVGVSKEILSNDILWMLASFVLLLIFMFVPTKYKISRIGGVVLLAFYISYIYMSFNWFWWAKILLNNSNSLYIYRFTNFVKWSRFWNRNHFRATNFSIVINRNKIL